MPSGGRWYILLVSKVKLGAGAHALLGPLRDGVPTRAHSLKMALSFDSQFVAEVALTGLKRGQRLQFGPRGRERSYALPRDCTGHVVQIAPERPKIPAAVREVHTPYGVVKLKQGQMCLFGE